MISDRELDDLVDEMLSNAEANVPQPGTRQRATPLPAQKSIVMRAIRDARAAGLRLPAKFTLRFVTGTGRARS